jgi:hypothetical protein
MEFVARLPVDSMKRVISLCDQMDRIKQQQETKLLSSKLHSMLGAESSH